MNGDGQGAAREPEPVGDDTAFGSVTRRAFLGAAAGILGALALPSRGARAGASPAWEVRPPAWQPALAGDALPSWNDGAAKQAITDFPLGATDETSASFVPVADRIATFDLDGTLWVEMPLYAQSTFTVERVRQLAADQPDVAGGVVRSAEGARA